jgi:hypothetical protein
MKDAFLNPGNDLDDGWDDMAPPPSMATRSLAPPPELAALDEGWSDLAHSVPQASIAPISKTKEIFPNLSTIPPKLDELDDGWSDVFDERDPPPSPGRSLISTVKSPGKKERKLLERERRIKHNLAKKERSEKRREARRDEQKLKPSEPILRANAPRKKAITRQSEVRSNLRKLELSQSQTKPKVLNTEVSLEKNVTVSTPTHHSRSIPGWVLWLILAMVLLILVYFVMRR